MTFDKIIEEDTFSSRDNFTRHVNAPGITRLHSGNLEVEISDNNGEIVGILRDGIQIMHGGGKPEKFQTPEDKTGWKRSEILMFPIVGPTKDFRLGLADGKEIFLDQHGISRYIPFKIISASRRSIILEQEYNPCEEIINPKYKEGERTEEGKISSRPKAMRWPFQFRIQKEITIHEAVSNNESPEYSGSIEIVFRIMNQSESPMTYMFGFHPAFRAYGKQGKIRIEEGKDTKEVALDGFLGKDQTNYYKNTGEISFECSKYKMMIQSSFNDTMIWSAKDSGMICIEPVSNIPKDLEDSNYCISGNNFETILPGEKRTYEVKIFI